MQPTRQTVGVATSAGSTRRRQAVTVWLVRAAWVGLGASLSTVVDEQDTATWILAAAWVVGAIAVSVPAVWSLTIARVLVPTAPVAVVAAAVGDSAGHTAALIVAAISAGVATAGVVSADLGAAYVQASAYGAEVRFLLQPPAGFAVAAGMFWVLWAAAATVAVAGAATDQRATGLIAGAVAIGLGVLSLPRWHRLSRRWLVRVPAGVVVHDPLVLTETLMMRHREIAAIGLAPEGTAAADLTGPAGGTAIEIITHEAVTVLLADGRSNPRGKAIHARAVLVSPTRPGRTLDVLTSRGS